MSPDTDSRGDHEQTRAAEMARRFSVVPIKHTVRLFGPSLLVGLVAPFVFPIVRRSFGPVVKGLIKGGVRYTESLKEAVTDVREQINDAVAEVKAEQDQDAKASRSSKHDA